ncbi:hypothetical protein K457DRAFT_1882607 [Linnemannia elongata AG-77]|uniref:Carrier domain-containing protein n=1 Tax=Linnemannia elongata AG-77 TaxID=1314771 RepID=A0A197JB07_9FUNG|nr:hypothetical protein K457DRAFT_1882607 [Linnemannia elongata AG-77]
MPLTPNGKLDRRALPAPDDEAFARRTYESPQGEIETALARIWAELFKIEQISRHDSFFALGGHSLLAVQMIERLRRLGLTVSRLALRLAEPVNPVMPRRHPARVASPTRVESSCMEGTIIAPHKRLAERLA